MSNTVLTNLVTKQKFSSINDVIVDINDSKNPLILVDDLSIINGSIKELESISNELDIDVLVQNQNEETETDIGINSDLINVFSEINEEIFERISDSDLLIYLGNDIERFQGIIIDNNVKTYQVSYRNNTNTFDENVILNNFCQINSNESGFIKALLIMI
jgi:hypothetical protein